MNSIVETIIKRILVRSSIELVRIWPSHLALSLVRRLNGIQLTAEQLKAISTTIKDKAPCKLLVFGLGNDSVFWHSLNRGGITIFMEDSDDWFHRITKSSKELMAFLIKYNTRLTDWKILLESPSLLEMDLPDQVNEEDWDIILVDAPAGFKDQTPGRMKSIYYSSKLIKKSGDVFVHDCDREVENVYCNRFLKKENLKIEIKGIGAFLRHYHITSDCDVNTRN